MNRINLDENDNNQEEQKSRNILLIVTGITVILLILFLFIAVSMWQSGRAAAEITGHEYVSEENEDSDGREGQSTFVNDWVPGAGNNTEVQPDEEETSSEETRVEPVGGTYDNEENFDNVPGADNGEEQAQGIFDDEYGSDYEEIEFIGDAIGQQDNYEYSGSFADGNSSDFVTVDESYFSDALFIGDSRMYGFSAWSEFPSTFYAAVGFQLYKYETYGIVNTDDGKLPIFDAIPYDSFTKIYIKVGLNEIGWGSEKQFEDIYADFIARLRETQPRAIIYIHGLLPVTREQDALGNVINNNNINARNAAFEEFAKSQNAYFLNVGEAYKDGDGYLPTEKSSDGIHLRANYIDAWKQYLMEHAIRN